jgi:hypothetical protein
MTEENENSDKAIAMPEQEQSRNAKNKIALIFVLCALAVPIATAIFNPSVHSWTHERNGVSIYEGDVLITQDDMQPTSGDFAWRYFEWGIFEGAHTPQFRYLLRPMLGYEAGNETARIINITNPTPFHITIVLLVIAWMFRRSALKEDREEKADTKDQTLMGLNR